MNYKRWAYKPQRCKPQRCKLQRCKTLAMGLLSALASLGAAGPLHAAPPEPELAPSYAANASTTIAALVQSESRSDQDNTLRGERELEQKSLELVDGLSSDPIDEEVGSRSIFAGRRTELVKGRLKLPPIEALTTDTNEIGNGELPLGFRQGAVSPVMTLPESGINRELPWQWNERLWTAANTFSHPLYFEDRMLERHGHQRHPFLQPLMSGGRFLAQGAILPYLATINPPCECQYTLGYYRAGSCAPALKQRPPYQRKAAVAQAAAVVAAVAIIP